MSAGFMFTLFFIALIYLIRKTFIVVPERYCYVVERLGVFKGALKAGFHFLWPVIEVVKYRQNLKEIAIDIPPQMCITKDNVSISVDGILYLKVVDAYKASYAIENFMLATQQLAQTTLRSEIGKLILDQTFSERDDINSHVVRALDEATDPWGIKVTRYEIKNISPPKEILHEMEEQVKAERVKRAEITISEGEKLSRINRSVGEREEAINISEGEKMKKINEAEGKALEIELIAAAKAKGIRMIAESISKEGGEEAVNLQITEDYLTGLGEILSTSKTTILPAELANIASVFEGLSKVTGKLPEIKTQKEKEGQ
ncbi:SPFH domain-containing protein [Leptospira kirschneri]|uniref:SPFH domain-containing protein n=1 Tax=Leptospira kirschneri TaxID=29507 RepID=UPI00028935C6|nr:stomatin-like protein [Leptospira kirschneri]EKQ84124.1 SPFH domain/Band 7 family protein [Leptospira kirschneri serovar Grippotyphosa str. Moskva]EKR09868.1 SPFH domain/Band 7 family protein [Leptospira kirschneri serovar Valbuzzi str. 200702274]EMJ98697.1 SPFH domain/Band 7 family protein [Leptospira kirschneri str. MMD1493]EMK17126.1 SPFH domain/Band 7 family protein [Leptospira kirschneri serovar Bim str. PUO 1247]EMN04196.1 SPFH domain/Band 7 family protein [Leptospira kirschneri serov